MQTGIHYQDRSGTIEQAAKDFGLDTSTPDIEVRLDGDYPNEELISGDTVEFIKSRNRRVDSVTGTVVKQTSPDRVDVFWPDVLMIVSTRIKKLRKVEAR